MIATVPMQPVNNKYGLADTTNLASFQGRVHLTEPSENRRIMSFQLICTIAKGVIELQGLVRLGGTRKREVSEIHFAPNKKKPPNLEEIVPRLLLYPEHFTVTIEPQATLPYKITISNNCELSILSVDPSKLPFPRHKKNYHFYSFDNTRQLTLAAKKELEDKRKISENTRSVLTEMVTEFTKRPSTTPAEIIEILDVFAVLDPAQQNAIVLDLVQRLETKFSISEAQVKALGQIFDHLQKYTVPGRIASNLADMQKSVNELVAAQTGCLRAYQGRELSPAVLTNILKVLAECLKEPPKATFTGVDPEESKQESYQLAIQQLRTLASLLELLVKAKFANIPRESVQAPILEILKNYRRHTDPRIAFYYEYCFYLFAQIKNDESDWHAFLRYTSYIALGAIKVAEVYQKGEFKSVVEALKNIKGGLGGIIDGFKKAAPKIAKVAEVIYEKGSEAVAQAKKVDPVICLSDWPVLYYALKQGIHEGNELQLLSGLNDLLKLAERQLPLPTDPKYVDEKAAQDDAKQILATYPTKEPFFVAGLVEVLGDILVKCCVGEIEEGEREKECKRERVIIDLLIRIFNDNLHGGNGTFTLDHSIMSKFQDWIQIGTKLIECGKCDGKTNYGSLQKDIILLLLYCSSTHPRSTIRYKARDLIAKCQAAVKLVDEKYRPRMPEVPLKLDYVPASESEISPASLLGRALATCAPWREKLLMLRRNLLNDPILTSQEENYVPLKVTTAAKTKKLFKDAIVEFLRPRLAAGQKDVQKSLLIEGGPGSGKSFGTRKALKDIQEEYHDSDDYFPIIIPLPTTGTEPATAVNDFFRINGLDRYREVYEKQRLAFFLESLDEMGPLTKKVVKLNQGNNPLWKFVVLSRTVIQPQQKHLLWPANEQAGFSEVLIASFDTFQRRAGYHLHNENARKRGQTVAWEVSDFARYEKQFLSVKKLTKVPLFHHMAAQTLPGIAKKNASQNSDQFIENDFTEAMFCFTVHRELNAQEESLKEHGLQDVLTNKKQFVDCNIRIHMLFDAYLKEADLADAKSKPDPKIPHADLNDREGLKVKVREFHAKHVKDKPLDEAALELAVTELTDDANRFYFLRRCCPITQRQVSDVSKHPSANASKGGHTHYLHQIFWSYFKGVREDGGKARHLTQVLEKNDYKFLTNKTSATP